MTINRSPRPRKKYSSVSDGVSVSVVIETRHLRHLTAASQESGTSVSHTLRQILDKVYAPCPSLGV